MSRVNRNSYGMLLAGIAVITLSLVLLLKVMSLSLNRGDSVPPGSSLRTDPKGTKVLFRSLASIQELNVNRNYTELSQQDLPQSATMFIIGVTAKTAPKEFFDRGYLHTMSEREFDALNTFVTNGGRLVLTMNDTLVDSDDNQSFSSSDFTPPILPGQAPIAPPGLTPPTTTPPMPPNPPKKSPPAAVPPAVTPPQTTPTPPATPGNQPTLPPNAGPGTGTKGNTPPPPKPPANNMLGMPAPAFEDSPFIKRWNADYARDALTLSDEEDYYIPTIATPSADNQGLSIQQWHSGYYFSGLDDNWNVIYASRNHPVVIERSVGSGSVVLISDSYFLSNQGLRRKPNGKFIQWLLAGNDAIIFNERHLNVREDTGASSLVYRYNLQWFGGTLILIAILYIWRCTTSLVPLRDNVSARRHGFVKEGMEAREGFAQLLQRNIPDNEILKVCYDEWLRSESKSANLDDETMQHINRVATDEEVAHNHKLISEAYRRICDYINKRRY